MKNLSVTKKIMLGLTVLLFFAALVGYEGLTEENSPNEIMVIQMPFTGNLDFHFTAGTKMQLFGTVTTYPKSFQFWFDKEHKTGMGAIPTRFADASSATITGGVRIAYPRNAKHMRSIHETYGSREAVEAELVNSVIQKSFYNIGPLMTAQESYKDRRPDIIRLAQDMANNGVYKVITKDFTVIDAITEKKKTVQKMELVEEPGAPGGFARQEESKLAAVNIVASNMAISQITYEDKVLKQIEDQQKAQMAVQTAIARAKEAKQDAITEEEKGKAATAKAKWAQEVIRATAVTKAEQNRDVAKLARDEAEFTKQKLILEGEGEAEKKRLIMVADGALKQKLAAHVDIQKAWAAAWAKNGANIVPIIQGGSGGKGSGNGTLEQFIQTQTLSNLKTLQLDMKMTTNKKN